MDVSISQNAEALSSAILSFVNKHNILKVSIIAQIYDEPNVMSGENSGVQKKLKTKLFFYLFT